MNFEFRQIFGEMLTDGLFSCYIVAGNDGDRPLGPLALFSFLVQTRVEKLPYKEQHQHLRAAIRNHLQDGVLLETREKGGKQPDSVGNKMKLSFTLMSPVRWLNTTLLISLLLRN